MNTLRPSATPRAQRGVVLVISLLLLLILTMIGLAATRSTTLEERMVANQRDQDIAFQAAEAALRDGESALQGANPGDFSSNTKGYYNADPGYLSVDWSNTSTTTIEYDGTLNPAPVSPPRYYIFETAFTGTATGQSLAADAPSNNPTIYEIYARGVGLSGNNVVYLESAYQR